MGKPLAHFQVEEGRRESSGWFSSQRPQRPVAEGSPTCVRSHRESGSGHPEGGTRGGSEGCTGPGLCFATDRLLPGPAPHSYSDRKSSQAPWALRDTCPDCHHRERKPRGTGTAATEEPAPGSQTGWPHTRKYQVFSEPDAGGNEQQHPNTGNGHRGEDYRLLPTDRHLGERSRSASQPRGERRAGLEMPRTCEGAGLGVSKLKLNRHLRVCCGVWGPGSECDSEEAGPEKPHKGRKERTEWWIRAGGVSANSCS